MRTKLLFLLVYLMSGCATIDVTIPENALETAIRSGYFIGCGELVLKDCNTESQFKEAAELCRQMAESFDLSQIGISQRKTQPDKRLRDKKE